MPTPSARDWKGPNNRAEARRPTCDNDLPTVAELYPWPTSKANDAGRGGSEERADGQRMNLSDYAMTAPWATATAMDARGSRNETSGRQADSAHHSGQTLCDQIQGLAPWATPAANEFEPRDIEAMEARRAELKAQGVNGNGFGLTLGMQAASLTPGPNTPSSGAGTGRRVACRLNPSFSLWLMGIPASRWNTSSPHWDSLVTVERLLAEYYARPGATEPAG